MFGTPIEVDGETFMWWMEDSKWIAVNAISMFGEPFFYSVVFYFGGGAGEGVVRGMMEGKIKRLTK
ncbi:hypothetical protein MYOV003v1_p0115 [Vibrio phage 207E48.1]|nr:hypothetical protein MYOV003v1_p0115 [Vibrio phage 207E48.1]